MSKSVIFNGRQVDLISMLDAREQRSLTQRQLLSANPKAALLSATMNIPGPVKTSVELQRVFEQVLELVHAHPTLIATKPLATVAREKATGPEFYLLIDLPAKALKLAMIEIEQSHAWGRLLDLDVLYCEGSVNLTLETQSNPMINPIFIKSLSRSDLDLPSRRCLICDDDAKVCGRSRKHSVEEMQTAITYLIKNVGGVR